MAYPTKPTIEKPEWATDGGAVVTEPPAPKKSAGWEYVPLTNKGEIPVMNYTNWLGLSTYQWISWSESALDNHETRVAVLETYTSGVSIDTVFWLGV